MMKVVKKMMDIAMTRSMTHRQHQLRDRRDLALSILGRDVGMKYMSSHKYPFLCDLVQDTIIL